MDERLLLAELEAPITGLIASCAQLGLNIRPYHCMLVAFQSCIVESYINENEDLDANAKASVQTLRDIHLSLNRLKYSDIALLPRIVAAKRIEAAEREVTFDELLVIHAEPFLANKQVNPAAEAGKSGDAYRYTIPLRVLLRRCMMESRFVLALHFGPVISRDRIEISLRRLGLEYQLQASLVKAGADAKARLQRE